MADTRKKYWLKLDKNFLKSPQMKVIRNMPNGKDYIIFYLSLMLESVETVGHLRFTSLVPYNAEMLSSITETNVDIVKSAIKIFCELGMMQIFDDGTIFMTEVPKITGKESESAERVRQYRIRQEEQKALQCNTNVTKCNDNKDKDKNKYKYKEEDKDIYSPAKQDDVPYKDIIEYLNFKTGKHYKTTTPKTLREIKARINEGFELEDFKIVIDNKCSEWLKDKKMNQYLRPDTLFGTKFESYLNQTPKEITTKDLDIDISDF
jgi:predicted phage replisome organizer/uncharacterized phage protein (TIGR02220 family)